MSLDRLPPGAPTEDKDRSFRLLFENTGDAIYLTRGDGTILEANEAACRMHRMTVDEIRAAGRRGLLVHDERLDANLREREAKGRWRGDLQMRRKDGSTFPVELESVVVDAGGPSWTTFVIARDLTDRLRAEEERRRAEAADLVRNEVERIASELRDAQRIARVGSWSLDLKTCATFWSEEMFAILGKEAAAGPQSLAALSAISAPEFLDQVRRALDRVLAGAEDATCEGDIFHPDQSRRRVVLRLVSRRDASGDVIGARGTIQDITEQRNLEEQLSRSQRLDAIGSLAGGVAHDFNNLLGVIMGYAECAIEDAGDPEALRQDLREIVSAGRRAATLTRRLLAFSRRQILQPEVHAPADLVRDLSRMLRRLIGENIDLRLHLAEEATFVLADPAQIEQVIMNLVVNARDAMPDGGVLTIETTALETAPTGGPLGSYVQISVRDTGTGMTRETLSHIFEPFFTTKAPGRGTGLGLSTVFGIVKQSGGFLDVESVPGRGTAFRVLLPRVPAPTDSARPGPSSTKTIPQGTGTVLVIEDDGPLRAFVARSLVRAGFDVVTAASGEAGLRVARATPDLQLLVTDLVMPGMSGSEVARAIRQVRPHLPVLYISGYVDEGWGGAEALLDGESFLPKPFTSEELLRKVHETRRMSSG
ncbi:MAG: ATP-binding protein [Polyangiaceae bacterium]